MPYTRLNNAQRILKSLRKIEKFYVPTTTPVVDVLSAAVAAAAAAVTVTTFGSWATADDIIVVGSGGMELNRFGTKPGSAAPIPLRRPAVLAQDTGAVISKATRADLGYIEDAGGSFGGSASKTGIGAANAVGAIAFIDGEPAEPSFSWGVRESDLKNILGAYGIDEDAIVGAGTDADPYVAYIGSDNIGSAANFCLRLSGLLVNNRTQYAELWNCTPEVNISAAFGGKGTPVVWNMSVKYTKSIFYDLAVAI